VHQDHMD